MKKPGNAKRTASVLVAGSLLASAAAFPSCAIMHPSLYGPPPTSEFDPASNVLEDLYGPPIAGDYDVTENLTPTIYGPPSDETGDTASADTGSETETETETAAPDESLTAFSPEDNVAEPLYGPPEMMG